MKSKIPLTGYCNYQFCNKPTPYRFCCLSHNVMYHYRLKHPEVKQRAHNGERTPSAERRRGRKKSNIQSQRAIAYAGCQTPINTRERYLRLKAKR